MVKKVVQQDTYILQQRWKQIKNSLKYFYIYLSFNVIVMVDYMMEHYKVQMLQIELRLENGLS
ncbi:unnamed protein product [Paramecium sonneborni]|uniref:Uncharacterized protein n=1 Tax=Paramecium sonneborni TaxID=65129 RepID=A0A8S1Q482_9CILI|nr:unnamed protein product [Paramecium sonneborni]